MARNLERVEGPVLEPVEGGLSANRVHADHPTQHAARHFGREVPSVELGEDLGIPVASSKPRRDASGPVVSGAVSTLSTTAPEGAPAPRRRRG